VQRWLRQNGIAFSERANRQRLMEHVYEFLASKKGGLDAVVKEQVEARVAKRTQAESSQEAPTPA